MKQTSNSIVPKSTKSLREFCSVNAVILVVVSLMLAMTLLYLRSSVELSDEWGLSSAYSHGSLALLVALYLFWLDSHHYQNADRYGWLPIAGLAACGALWFLSSVANVFLLEMLAFAGLFACALATLYGAGIWWKSLAAFVTIGLALPVWDLLQAPLQSVSAEVTHQILEWWGIPVFRQSYLFTVPGGSFFIEEACSGLGFLLTSCLLAIVYARVFKLSIRQSSLLIASAIGLALFSNWLRIAVIMIVGNTTRMTHPIVTDHLTFGWVLFAGLLIPFFWLVILLMPGKEQVPPEAEVRTRELPKLSLVGLVFLGLLVPPALLVVVENRPQIEPPVSVKETTQSLLPVYPGSSLVNWNPTFVGASEIVSYRSRFEQDSLLVLVVRYDKQTQGEELIYVENSLYDKTKWKQVSQDSDGDFNTLQLINRRGNIRLMNYTYVVNGALAHDPREAKLQEMLGLLTGRRVAHLIAVAIDGAADRDIVDDRVRLSAVSRTLAAELLKN